MQRWKCGSWVIGLSLGAAFGVLLNGILAWEGVRPWVWRDAITLAMIGALFGQSLWRNVPAVRDALREGQWLSVAAWTIFAAVVGGAMGLLAKSGESKDLPALLPENPVWTWLIGAAVGLLFALVGLGEGRRSATKMRD